MLGVAYYLDQVIILTVLTRLLNDSCAERSFIKTFGQYSLCNINFQLTKGHELNWQILYCGVNYISQKMICFGLANTITVKIKAIQIAMITTLNNSGM